MKKMLSTLRMIFALLLAACLLVRSVNTQPSPSLSQPPSPSQPQPSQQPTSTANPNGPTSGSVASPSSGVVTTIPTGNNTSQAPLTASDSGSGNFVTNLPTSASIPYTAQAAYASFATPTAPGASEVPLYPVNGNVTFVWHYDQNLKVRPVSLTLCAVPTSDTKYTYTIAQMPGDQTSAVWEMAPLSTGGAPLQNGKYQIQLFDQRGLKHTYSPGWLEPATQLTIGLYNPQTYTPFGNPSQCATCFFENSFPKDSVGPLVTTFGVALLTTAVFLWYAL